MRARTWISAGAFVAVAAGALGWFAITGNDDAANEQADAIDPATASVRRRDLVERETFDGSLGYADERTLLSGRTGTITWIVDEGEELRRGDAIYEVDERPVVAMLGEVPAYRTMASGVEGTDVRQLQRNLLALGFDDDGDVEVTGEFDADTEEAVRDWQEDLGLERTGVVEPGDVVFFPAPRRMGAHAVDVGAGVAPSTQVATTTSLERTVTLDLDASDQDLVERGDRVQIELPSGERVSGRISSVATVAETDPDNPDADPTVEVTIRLLGVVETSLDEAPVDVDIETSRVPDALAVPLQALLALAEGGYALEVVDGPGRTHLVGVETGSFADGFVEVAGEDVAEGLEVVIAS
jgi:peptidoglycan hydrolase-like protein with peptidoglycan-binding domain